MKADRSTIALRETDNRADPGDRAYISDGAADFIRRFGDKVSVINSRQSRENVMISLNVRKRGEVQVMIGPRSALFTTFGSLGLIIIDEEHDQAIKVKAVHVIMQGKHAIPRASLRTCESGNWDRQHHQWKPTVRQ